MSHELVQRFLRSVHDGRNKGGKDVPKDEDPRESQSIALTQHHQRAVAVLGGGQILTLGEVAQILKALEMQMMEHAPEATLTPSLKATMEYVEHFKKGDEVATLQQMRE